MEFVSHQFHASNFPLSHVGVLEIQTFLLGAPSLSNVGLTIFYTSFPPQLHSSGTRWQLRLKASASWYMSIQVTKTSRWRCRPGFLQNQKDPFLNSGIVKEPKKQNPSSKNSQKLPMFSSRNSHIIGWYNPLFKLNNQVFSVAQQKFVLVSIKFHGKTPSSPMLSKHLLTLTSTWTREACEVCVFLLGKGGCNTNALAKNEGRLLSTTKNAIELVVLLVGTGIVLGTLYAFGSSWN